MSTAYYAARGHVQGGAQPAGARGLGNEGEEEGQGDPEQTPLLGGVR